MRTMRNNNNIFAILFGGILFLTASCVKENNADDLYRPAGTPIKFTIASEYENGDATRAEYSGAIYGSTTRYERINWEVDDPITISYTNGTRTTSSNYTVTYVTGSTDKTSTAAITSQNGLVWDGRTGGHTFYGLYPAGATGAAGSLSGSTVTGSIPSLQPINSSKTLNAVDNAGTANEISYIKYQPDTEHYGYMIARRTVSSSSTESLVNLPFRPAVTTFEFKLQMNSGYADRKVSSIVLSSTSTYLSGDFTFSIGDDGTANGGPALPASSSVGTPSGGSRGRSITVSFGDTGISIPKNSYLDFSILALPIDQTELTLTINYTNGSPSSKHLDFKTTDPSTNNTTWATFTGGKKYTITNVEVPGGTWTYHIDQIDDVTAYGHTPIPVSGETIPVSVRSYKYYQDGSNPIVYAPVPWKVQYTADTSSNPSPSSWINLTASGYTDANLTTTTFKATPLSGSGGVTAETVNLSIDGTHNSTETGNQPLEAATAKLRAASSRGTSQSPWDLSMHDISGNPITNRTTANCYIVSAPGVYMFPCVYGNAITNGSTNTSAFRPESATSASITGESSSITNLSHVNTVKNIDANTKVYYLPRFRNAGGQGITSPYVLEDFGNITITPEAAIVWQDKASSSDGDIISVDDIGFKTVDNHTFLVFSVDKENIRPGNVVIALRNSSNDLVLWSWHIWVTEKDFSSNQTISYSGSNSYDIMKYNLGWIDSPSGSVSKYKDRSLKYRIVQVENNTPRTDNAEVFTFTQKGDVSSSGNPTTVGRNPYYQWGRKDPLLPMTGSSTDAPYTGDYTLSPNSVTTLAISPIDYLSGIQNPHVAYSNALTTSWIGGTVYPFHKEGWYIKSGHEHRGPWNVTQALYVNNTTLNDGAHWDTTSYPGYYYITSNWYNYGPYSDQQTMWLWDSATYGYGDLGFVSSDFEKRPYSASERSQASIPYNLWNSYIYLEKTTGSTYTNKYKTIYDPCPAGYAVPTKQVFLNSDSPSFTVTSSYLKHTTALPDLTKSQQSGLGLLVNSTVLLPYTGLRNLYNGSLAQTDYGSGGSYWIDNPFQIEHIGSNQPTDNIAYFRYYQYAYMFTTSGSDHEVQTWTRGTAASIRPMVDPNYTPTYPSGLNLSPGNNIEGVSFGDPLQ